MKPKSSNQKNPLKVAREVMGTLIDLLEAGDIEKIDTFIEDEARKKISQQEALER